MREESVSVGTDSSGGARGNFTEVITARCGGGEIAPERSMLKHTKKWTVDEA